MLLHVLAGLERTWDIERTYDPVEFAAGLKQTMASVQHRPHLGSV